MSVLFAVLLAQEIVAVEIDSPMRYLAGATDPGVAMEWVAPSFDDSAWDEGSYGVGYNAGGMQELTREPGEG